MERATRYDGPPQFQLRTIMWLVVLIAVVLGILRLPPVAAASVLAMVNLLAFAYAAVGTVAIKNRYRLVYLGWAICLGGGLFIGQPGRGANLISEGAMLDSLLALTGRDQWSARDMHAAHVILWQLLVMATGGLGAAAGLIHARRQPENAVEVSNEQRS